MPDIRQSLSLFKQACQDPWYWVSLIRQVINFGDDGGQAVGSGKRGVLHSLSLTLPLPILLAGLNTSELVDVLEVCIAPDPMLNPDTWSEESDEDNEETGGTNYVVEGDFRLHLPVRVMSTC